MTDQNKSSPEPMLPRMSEVGEQKPLKTSGFAVASFALGIVSVATCGLTSLLGLIFGIISIIQIKFRKVSNCNKFYAISGTVINIIMMAFLIFMITSQKSIQDGHKTIACSTNLKQLGTAMMMYANENDECLPTSDKWIDSLSPYMRNSSILKCPSVLGIKSRTSYAMNNGISGVKEDKLNDSSGTVLLFDSTPGDCPHGGIELIPSPERHIVYLNEDYIDIKEIPQKYRRKLFLKVNNFYFADGHIKQITADMAPSLIWNPVKK